MKLSADFPVKVVSCFHREGYRYVSKQQQHGRHEKGVGFQLLDDKKKEKDAIQSQGGSNKIRYRMDG